MHSNALIDNVLRRFQSEIGPDYERYRNHVYRVYSFCLQLDKSDVNRDKYAIAAAFHDLGIWTDHTFDYLQPSMWLAELYLEESGRAAWNAEIAQMIYWHHKLSPYAGEATAEIFRRADWIDVSLGALRFGLERQAIRSIRKQWPNAGFHLFLLKKSAVNFLEHPLNPLPVFKK